MRFNFITVYSDKVVPLFSPSSSVTGEVVTFRGASESIFSRDSSIFFGPIFSSFDSSDFSIFSKSYVRRNSYLSSYAEKKIRRFVSGNDLSIYKNFVTAAFEKNAIFYKRVKNFKYDSLIFRSNGFRLGSLAARTISPRRIKFFQFFRNFSFYELFRRFTSSIFLDKSQVGLILFNFISLFKTSFFRYFLGLGHSARVRKIFKIRGRQKMKFIKQAFLFFFFFRKRFHFFNNYLTKSGFGLNMFPSFYLSEAIFFSSRISLKKTTMRRFLPLAIYLFFTFSRLIMPQLDLFSLGNQFFWGVIFFVLFYFLVSYYVIPSVFSIMFARTFYSNKLNSDSVKLLCFCFVFSSIATFYYSDILTSIQTTLDSSYINKFVYNIALSEYVDLEISEIYDNNYFNDDEKQQ